MHKQEASTTNKGEWLDDEKVCVGRRTEMNVWASSTCTVACALLCLYMARMHMHMQAHAAQLQGVPGQAVGPGSGGQCMAC
jgi:hypothetical protein